MEILEGLVPNIFPPKCTKASDRRGRTSPVSHITVGRLGTLEYNSFRGHVIRLFNQLPLVLRNATVCSIHSFKKSFYLSTVPEFPCQPGFNNSLDHGDSLRWRKPRDGLAAAEQQKVRNLHSVGTPKLSEISLTFFLMATE